MEDIILCQYGCGQEAKFVNKSGKHSCSKHFSQCPVNRKKNSQNIKIAHEKYPEKWINIKKGGFASKSWVENNPDKYKTMHKQSGATFKQRLQSGEISHPWTGKNHTKQAKQKISEKMYERTCRGWSHCKYFEIFNPTTNEIVKVQGTWQLKYAKYLNQNKINWIRSRKINLKYRLHKDDYLHTYYPDFYLPDNDQYVEIKGRYQQQHKVKMNKVLEQNKDKTIKILFKKDLQLILNQKL